MQTRELIWRFRWLIAVVFIAVLVLWPIVDRPVGPGTAVDATVTAIRYGTGRWGGPSRGYEVTVPDGTVIGVNLMADLKLGSKYVVYKYQRRISGATVYEAR